MWYLKESLLYFFNQFSRAWTCLSWTMVQQFSRPCSTSTLWSRAWRTQWEPGTTLHASAGTSTTVNRRWTMVIRRLNCLILVQMPVTVQVHFLFCLNRHLLDRPKPRLCCRHHRGDVQLHCWGADLPKTSHSVQGIWEAHGLLVIWWSTDALRNYCISHQKECFF